MAYLHSDLTKIQEHLATTTLEKRAATNAQRLRAAFDIDNAFTTTDVAYYQAFREFVEEKLDTYNTTQQVQDATLAARNYLCEVVDQNVSVAKLVQIVVLRIVLKIFFELREEPSNEDLGFIATKIISLWYDSKDSEAINKAIQTEVPSRTGSTLHPIIQDKIALLEKLEKIFEGLPDCRTSEPRENPLRIILPAFMGLWRSVFRCFLEHRFRHDHSDREQWAQILENFLDNETGGWYPESEGDLSASMSIAEVLRLYPPTRRIYMQEEDGLHGVDIEALHRAGDNWGAHPLEFDPKRWTNKKLDVRTNDEYMPFGDKKVPKEGPTPKISSCPSRRRGGPQLIATLTGVLLREIGESWRMMETEISEERLPETGPLNTDRGAYESLRVCKNLQ